MQARICLVFHMQLIGAGFLTNRISLWARLCSRQTCSKCDLSVPCSLCCSIDVSLMTNPPPRFYKYKVPFLFVNSSHFAVRLAAVAESRAKLVHHTSALCVFLKGFWSGEHMADSNLHFNYTAQFIGRYLSRCRWRPRALTRPQSRCDSAFRQLSQRGYTHLCR